MDLVCHYTSRSLLESMRELGLLLALSNPFDGGNDPSASKLAEELASAEVRSHITHAYYVVGIPLRARNSWESSGLLERIIKKTGAEVLLQFPIMDGEGVFFRDAKYLTVGHMMRVCGMDFWSAMDEGIITPAQFVALKCHKSYIGSTIPLRDYDGTFAVPEIWLPQDVPIETITVVEMI